MSARIVVLVLVDESGPIGGQVLVPAEIDTISLEQCVELLTPLNPRAAEAVAVKRAEHPASYTPMGCDVLLVQVPGTHEVRRPARARAIRPRRSGGALLARGLSAVGVALDPRVEAARRAMRRAEDEPEVDAHDLVDRRELFPEEGTRWGLHSRTSTAPAPTEARVLDDKKVINTCTTCGTSYTEATWAELPMVGAKDVEDGGTIVHEDYRECGCGSTRMVFTTREAAA